ncbi:MAG: hypothetical protein AAFX87_19810 [Bacteroidota bacterium]
MKRQGDINEQVRKAMKGFPEFEPDQKLWTDIESQLDFAETLAPKLKDLPDIHPDDQLWNRLDDQLIGSRPKGKVVRLRFGISMAAAVALILAVKFFAIDATGPEQSIVYSEEYVQEDELEELAELDNQAENALTLIEERFADYTDLEDNEEFFELKTQLDQVLVEEESIKEEISAFGRSPELIKAQIKIENLKSELTKLLINMIMA